MPTFILDTNVSRDAIPASFITELSALVAKTVGKPESYVAVHVRGDQLLTFGGSAEPCALGYLGCIGKLGLEENKTHTAVLMEKINKDLGIPLNRMYINFTDHARQNVGYNGSTFA